MAPNEKPPVTSDPTSVDRRALLARLAVGLVLPGLSVTANAQETDADGENDTGQNATDAENATGEGDDTDGQNATDDGNATQDGNETSGGGESVTVELVDYAYEPGTESPLEIPPGTLVQFVWVTDNHNVNVDEQPEAASWPGHDPIENSPFEYEYTFDVEGTYEFHCDPHIGQGMEGTIVVDPAATTAEGGEGVPELVPDQAWTLIVATLVVLLAVLGLAYAFLRFGGPTE